VQNLQDEQWYEPTVNAKLRRKMVKSFHEVFDIAARLQVDPRIAAYVLALGRVAAVTELRGIWP
jgi:glutamate dehydrogenase/leucine dehydrogenase